MVNQVIMNKDITVIEKSRRGKRAQVGPVHQEEEKRPQDEPFQ